MKPFRVEDALLNYGIAFGPHSAQLMMQEALALSRIEAAEAASLPRQDELPVSVLTIAYDPLLDLGPAMPPSELVSASNSETAHSEAFQRGVTPDVYRPLFEAARDLLIADGEPSRVNDTKAIVSKTSYLFKPANDGIPLQRVRLGYPLVDERDDAAQQEIQLVFQPAEAPDNYRHVITSNNNYFGAMTFVRLPGRTTLIGVGGEEFSADNPADVAAATEIIEGLQGNFEARVSAEAEEAQAAEQLLQSATQAEIDAEKAARRLRQETRQIKRQRRAELIADRLNNIGFTDPESAFATTVQTAEAFFENSVATDRPNWNYQPRHAIPLSSVSSLDQAILSVLPSIKEKLVEGASLRPWLTVGAVWLAAVTMYTAVTSENDSSQHSIQPQTAEVGSIACTGSFDAVIDGQKFVNEICQRATPFTIDTALPLAPDGTGKLPINETIADTAYGRSNPHYFSAHAADTVTTYGLSRYTIPASTMSPPPPPAVNLHPYVGYIGGDFKDGKAVAFAVDPDTHATVTVVNDHTLRVSVPDTTHQPTTVFIDQK